MPNKPSGSKLEWVQSVVERFEGPLVRYAGRIVGDLDRARDVVQDTFMRLCAEPQNRVEEHLAEWLFTVCRNRAVDVRRKESRMTPLTTAHLAKFETTEAAPSADLEHRETVAQILRVLDAIPQNQQEVIRLKFQNGFSYREISGVTGHSVGNVGFLIHTGLKAIRQRIRSESGLAPRA